MNCVVVVDSNNAVPPRRRRIAEKLIQYGNAQAFTHDGYRWDQNTVSSSIVPTCVLLHWTNCAQAFNDENLKAIIMSAHFRIAYSSDIFKEDLGERKTEWFRQEKAMRVNDFPNETWAELSEWMSGGFDVKNLPFILRPIERIPHLQMLGLVCDAFFLTHETEENLCDTGIPSEHLRRIARSPEREWFSKVKNWKELFGDRLSGKLEEELGPIDAGDVISSFASRLDGFNDSSPDSELLELTQLKALKERIDKLTRTKK